MSAVDPLNLTGFLIPGPRVPALTANRVLYRDGLPVATLIAGEVRFLVDMDAAAALAGPERPDPSPGSRLITA